MTESLAHTVDIDAVEGTVRAGETVAVTVAVANEGSDEGETMVELEADGQQVASESVDLDGEATVTTEFEWTPDADAVGTVELTASTGTEAATETVTVEDAPAEFTVAVDAVDEHVSAGGTVTVTATVTNEGTLAGSQKLEFRAEETAVETRALDLAGQTEETVAFEREVTEEMAPELTVTVASDDDEADASVPVVAGTVTPLRNMGSKSGMGLFGYLIFAGMAILLIPLLPILAVLKLVDMLTGREDAVR
jgi:hypothetical protein